MNITDYIFLDDIRTPASTHHVPLPRGNWKIVRNYKEFCNAIKGFYHKYQTVPEFVAFDHDLTEEHYLDFKFGAITREEYDKVESKEKTGYDCAKWLVDFCLNRDLPIPRHICHSMNPVGRINIDSCMNNARMRKNG